MERFPHQDQRGELPDQRHRRDSSQGWPGDEAPPQVAQLPYGEIGGRPQGIRRDSTTTSGRLVKINLLYLRGVPQKAFYPFPKILNEFGLNPQSDHLKNF